MWPIPHCYADIVAMPIHSLAHDQCRSFGIVLGPLHLPHQLEVGRDGGATMTRPMQIVEHHHIEVVGMVLGEGRRGEMIILLYRQYKWPCVTSPIIMYSTCVYGVAFSNHAHALGCVCSMSSL